MEDSLICIDDADSYHSASDSDIIDSETEAELYSSIHYEESLNPYKSENVNLSSELLAQSNSSSVLFALSKNVFCLEEKNENISQSVESLKRVLDDCNSNLEEKKSPDNSSFLNDKLKQFLSPAKKHKSDSDQNVTSLGHKILNDVLSKGKVHNSQVKQSNEKSSNSVRDYSSDSDSIIWTEVDSPEKTDFKTNIMKGVDTIYLSSSSDEDSRMSSLAKKQKNLNVSMPNIKVGEECKGLWHINNEDLYRQRKYSRRYHETIDVHCSNCNKKGHNFRTCPTPKVIKCFFCGGAHLGSNCVNRICGNCFNYGHDKKRCRMRPNNFYCELCCLEGHVKENCPDIWRRYHLTTNPTNIVIGRQVKQDTKIYCWNCGELGHFGGECQERVYKRLSTWPCVLSYNNPEELLKKRLGNIQRKNNCFGSDPHFRYRGNRNAAFTPGGQEMHFKQRNELNTTGATMEDGQKRKRGKRRKKSFLLKNQMGVQLQNIKKIIRESNFPRTPKKKIPKTELPKSVELSMQQDIKNNIKNRKRRRRSQKKLECNFDS